MKQWNENQRSAIIDDEGDAYLVALFDGATQVGGCFIPIGSDPDEAFNTARGVAEGWLAFADRMRDDRRGMGRRTPHIDNGPPRSRRVRSRRKA